jgi:hypothetical protein
MAGRKGALLVMEVEKVIIEITKSLEYLDDEGKHNYVYHLHQLQSIIV